MFTRQKVGIILAEFVATFLLATVFIAAASYFNFTAPWYVSIAVGIAYAMTHTVFSKISGAHANPAITIGLWTLRKIPSVNAIIYVSAQLLGGVLSLAFVEYVTGTDILSQGLSSVDGRIFLSEMVGAALFGTGVAAVIMQKLEGLQASFTVGISLTVGVLIASIASVGYINPAVSLANNTWDLTVVIAPVIGVILGMNTYSLFFAPEKSLLQRNSRKLKTSTRKK